MKRLLSIVSVFVCIGFSMGQTTIQLGGSGSMNNTDAPVCNLDNFSYTQQIYTAAEISAASLPAGSTNITALQFEYRGAAAGGENFNNWTIYLGNKTATTFSGTNDWTSVNQMTQVFNGIVAMPSASGVWFEVQFTTPFVWDGTSNIVVAIDENATGHNSPAAFRSYSGTNTVLRTARWNSIDPSADPSTYTSKVRLNNKPVIRFKFAGSGNSGGGNEGGGNEGSTDTTQVLNLKVTEFANFKGLTRFDGQVNLAGLMLNSTENGLLVLDENGFIQKTGMAQLAQQIYTRCDLVGPNGVPLNPVWANGSNKLFVDCPGVNVGIGTNNPRVSLDVRGTGYASKLSLGFVNPSEMAGFFHLKTSPSNNNDIVMTVENDQRSIFELSNLGTLTTRSQIIEVYDNSVSPLIIKNSTQQILKLENNGLLRARKIRVDSETWADFVFDENYNLISLKDLNLFISKNKHLPNIPSEKEVVENGLDVAELSKMLLQKIEELTLYLIQQDKNVETLEKQIEFLTQRIKELESQK